MPVRLQCAALASRHETGGQPDCADRDPGPDTLSVTVYMQGACWAFEVILASGRVPAGPSAALPRELVIVGAADGLSDAGAAIASALRASGMQASAVRLRGIIDDFVALGASGGTRLQTTGMPAAGISGAVAPLIRGIAFQSKSP